jgi:hypothetical protein
MRIRELCRVDIQISRWDRVVLGEDNMGNIPLIWVTRCPSGIIVIPYLLKCYRISHMDWDFRTFRGCISWKKV